MADRIPAKMVVIFDDGQALFLHGGQMKAVGLRYAGVAFPKELAEEDRNRENTIGYAFEIMASFLLAPGGVNADTDKVNDMIEPYLIHFEEIPPLDPKHKPPSSSGAGLVNWPGPTTPGWTQ